MTTVQIRAVRVAENRFTIWELDGGHLKRLVGGEHTATEARRVLRDSYGMLDADIEALMAAAEAKRSAEG
jgi:hypothetical protein